MKSNKSHKDPIRYKVIEQYEKLFKDQFAQVMKVAIRDLSKTIKKQILEK